MVKIRPLIKKPQLVLKHLIFINIDTVAYTITQIHVGSERKARRWLLKLLTLILPKSSDVGYF